MNILHTIQEVRNVVNEWKQAGDSIGFVPTMGYLHEGHRALIEQCRADNDRVVVSIFVNPSQFGPNEDLESYPRDLASDSALCDSLGVDAIFHPEAYTMYKNSKTAVTITDLGDYLCGQTRPTHFTGVCTVVVKLFNIVQPNRAYFGEKDRQQLRIIEKMVEDLNIPVHIIGVPIVRELDGLAKSSRNSYLSTSERKAATVLYHAILRGQQFVEEKIKTHSNLSFPTRELLSIMTHSIELEPLAMIDYISIVDYEILMPVEEIFVRSQASTNTIYVVAMAVYIGNTRLIDNFSFSINSDGGSQ